MEPQATAQTEVANRNVIKADVVIFGAGISGLTAAHELAERNFKVVVVDPQYQGADPRFPAPEEENPGVGGVARSQWGFLPNRSESLGEMQRPFPAHEMRATDPRPGADRLLVPCVLREDDSLGERVQLSEAQDFSTRKARGRLETAILPLIDAMRRDAEYQISGAVAEADDERAKVIKKAFRDLIGQIVAEQLSITAAEAADRVKITVGAIVGQPPGSVVLWLNAFALPGEHGFRFFPSFYRHVFDTMRRIPATLPIVDEYGRFPREGRATVYDNLVSVETVAYAGTGAKPVSKLPRRAPQSVDEVMQISASFLEASGLSKSDVEHLTRAFLKYATSSRRRREKEYEHLSWYDFLEGDRLSEQGRFLIETTPGTMLALSGSDGDARSHGTIGLQCMADQFTTSASDMLLNGPTDTAWFGPWYRYLRLQGVTFERARLERLSVSDDGGAVVPTVARIPIGVRPEAKPCERDASEPAAHKELLRFVAVEPDRPVLFILALPLLQAYALAYDLAKDLRQHERAVPRDIAALCSFPGTSSPRELCSALASPYPSRGPLRHLSGIQYFFNQGLRFWRAHTHYVQAPAGLTAISQPQFWVAPRNLVSGYRGVLSVDIGTWSRPHKNGRPVVRTSPRPEDYGWGRRRHEIATTVWDQISKSHEHDFKTEWIGAPHPSVYHLDDHLDFGANDSLAGNKAPFLVNQKGRYRRRPGGGDASTEADGSKHPIDYDVAFKAEGVVGGYVLAGIYMQTHTRINSMEAACESGRHAVNAILQAVSYPGERCETWDPEDFEPDALASARALDDELCARGLPHAFDIVA